ncbi:membrane-associated tyrosine- and threonine-specific cdc2-inhibitory kinase isoform X2 [Daphnia magna]|uniref:Membrane-associated tyrosine- and threonine-specific cdc2-inhibitory kinase n=1 Tax=Daphnia magna TaxID=35525 RepID=A0A0P5Z163_9CRUS|nr:membrane-associated tyrosine- and threonine-specific cdc2-inhibitory kinase isoform X2 [Daphnia magna]KAK4030399.1 hypothetical protein OUZ56_023398 [Daphnia magna]
MLRQMDSKFVTPRPVPQFNVINTFSTKKERTLPGQKKRAPPTPTPIISAYYSCPGPQKAHTISFKSKSDSALICSPHYNLSKEDTFFRQCFEIQANIGSGSFGDVFRVRSKEDGRMYAVKRSRVPFRGTTDRKEKLEEVRKMESLPHHPNCVRFYQAWEENQFLYIQLELCQSSLSEISEQQHELPEPLIWDYMIDLLLAIQHLHDNDLIHMDVKPENILLSMDGVCKLGDFGLVVNLKENLHDATEGDSKYLAPEVLGGLFSKKADIFSLGITLLELACDLDLPANGTLWHELRHGALPPSVTRHLSKELSTVLKMMMSPDVSSRPSASQLLQHPLLRSRRRWRCLKLGWHNACLSFRTTLVELLFRLFQLFLLIFLPIRALARKWRKPDFGSKPSTPVFQRPQPCNFANDYSFSDDEVSDLSSAVISGNDSTLGRPLNDSSPLPQNNSIEHRADEQPVSSTPLVLRGGRSSRHSSLRRSIFSRPTDHDSADDPQSNNMSYATPNKPIPRKLNDYFDAIASDSD